MVDINIRNKFSIFKYGNCTMAPTDQAVFLLRSKKIIGLCGKFEKCFSFPACKIAVNIHRGDQKIGNGVIGRPFRGKAGKIDDGIGSEEQTFQPGIQVDLSVGMTPQPFEHLKS